MRRVLLFLGAAFIVFFIVTQPHTAGVAAHGVITFIGRSFGKLGTFFGSLVTGK